MRKKERDAAAAAGGPRVKVVGELKATNTLLSSSMQSSSSSQSNPQLKNCTQAGPSGKHSYTSPQKHTRVQNNHRCMKRRTTLPNLNNSQRCLKPAAREREAGRKGGALCSRNVQLLSTKCGGLCREDQTTPARKPMLYQPATPSSCCAAATAAAAIATCPQFAAAAAERIANACNTVAAAAACCCCNVMAEAPARCPAC